MSELPRELQIVILKLFVNRDVRLYINIAPGKIIVPEKLTILLNRMITNLQHTEHCSYVKLGIPVGAIVNPPEKQWRYCIYWLVVDGDVKKIWGRHFIESLYGESWQGLSPHMTLQIVHFNCL